MSSLSFAAPAALAVAFVASAVIALLHFLSRQRPPRALFPTARFVPDVRASATSRARRPNDLLLLALRIAIVLLAGAAFARPLPAPSRRPLARVFLLDRSSAVADMAQGVDTVRALWREGDAVIVFDSIARRVHWTADSPSPAAVSSAGGSLSAALVAALRALVDLRKRADSLELVVVSPLAAEEVDRASIRLRALWPGSVRVARLRARERPAAAPVGLEVRAPPDDPLVIASTLAGGSRFETAARIVRDGITSEDSAWAREGGRVIVRWPRTSAPPSQRAIRADPIGAVVAGDVVVVAPFTRSIAASEGSTVARWVDGEPAAVERPLGRGCVRDVAIEVPTSGDLILSPAFGRLLRALTRPCAAARWSPPVPDSALRWLTGPFTPATQRAIAATTPSSPIASWLLGLALLLAFVEPFVRRPREAPSAGSRSAEDHSDAASATDGGVRTRAAGGTR